MAPIPTLSWRQRWSGRSATTAATVCGLGAPGASRTLRRGRPPVCSAGASRAGRSRQTRVTDVTLTTTTVYIGNLEEVSTAGSTTTTTYYYAGTQRIAVGANVSSNGSLSYLMTDALGSAAVALDGAGNVTAAQLYDPYGNGRYQSGTMPGSYGYTGQRSDALTGLNYDGARYYDPLASQLISADTLLPGNGDDPWGLSRYAYVEGNPLIRTDPTSHDGGWLGGIASAVSSTVSTVASAARPLPALLPHVQRDRDRLGPEESSLGTPEIRGLLSRKTVPHYPRKLGLRRY